MAGHSSVVKLMISKKRTWATLFALVYVLLLSCIWVSLRSIISGSGDPTSTFRWPHSVYAPVLFGVVLGLLLMLVVLALAVPVLLATWITILVLMALFRRQPCYSLLSERREVVAAVLRLALRIMVDKGKFVAGATCIIFGFFLLITVRGRLDSGIDPEYAVTLTFPFVVGGYVTGTPEFSPVSKD